MRQSFIGSQVITGQTLIFLADHTLMCLPTKKERIGAGGLSFFWVFQYSKTAFEGFRKLKQI
jgi:hypothetical protein